MTHDRLMANTRLMAPNKLMAPNLLPPASRPFDRLSAEELESLNRAHRADRFHDHCGVFGVHGHDDASHLTYLGLYALQHRGQESCGIVASTGKEHIAHRAMGLVADTFGAEVLDRLKGRHAIGHVRYSTSGDSNPANAQPTEAGGRGACCDRQPIRERQAPRPPALLAIAPFAPIEQIEPIRSREPIPHSLARMSACR
jgi:hypothetical protein